MTNDPAKVSGTHLGPYEILTAIGSGGMGQVYRARDSRLGREVAIKVAKKEFSDRFEQEARTIASLNHPHICRLYDVGPNYLVMELLEGTQLRTPQPLEKCLSFAFQILDALDAAHRKGIVHRDLKPANTMVTREGIKLLDFGLATYHAPALANGDETVTATVSDGAVTGTIQYMAPEQLTGKPVDGRSDLFSFGCLFYEMVSGKRAFESQSTAGVIAAILEKEPAPIALPPELQRVLRRCLAKDPDDRFQNARDLKISLQWAAQAVPTPVQAKRAKRFLPWFLAGAIFLCLAVVAAARWGRPRPLETPVIFAVEPPTGVTFNYLITGSAISPDGKMIVIRAGSEGETPALWLRPLDSLTAHRLSGTDGGDYPFWSPDSKSIAYFAGGKLQKLDIAGGTPTSLCDADAANAVAGGTWNKRGTILFADRLGLRTIASNGGMPTWLLRIDVASDQRSDQGPYGYPQFLPDQEHFLFFRQSNDATREGVYVASLAQPQQSRQLLSTSTKAVYAPSDDGKNGSLLFVRGHSLLAQSLDPAAKQLEGQPVVVAPNVSVLPALRAAAYWASDNGTLVYRSGLGLGNEKLVWVNRDGKARTEAAAEGTYTSLRLSPDGKRAAVGRQQVTDYTDLSDLWILDFERSTNARFTFGPEWNACPVWSPDGKQIAFISSRHGSLELYRKDAEGGGAETPLNTGNAEFKCPMDWSRDGKYLVYAQSNGGLFDLWALPLAPQGKPFLVAPPPFDKPDGQLSPDGHWLAYTSNESGRYEVYVKAFQGSSQGTGGEGPRWQLSNHGGRAPRWRGDGRELYYLSLNNKMGAVRVQMSLAGADKAATPEELFTTALPGNRGENQYPYDVTHDGQHFLVEESSDPGSADPLIVLVHWQATLNDAR